MKTSEFLKECLGAFVLWFFGLGCILVYYFHVTNPAARIEKESSVCIEQEVVESPKVIINVGDKEFSKPLVELLAYTISTDGDLMVVSSNAILDENILRDWLASIGVSASYESVLESMQDGTLYITITE